MKDRLIRLGEILGALTAIAPVLIACHSYYYMPYLKGQLKGGFGGFMAKTFKTSKDSVPIIIKTAVDNAQISQDSLAIFRARYKALMEEERLFIDVGLKVDKGNILEMKYVDRTGRERQVYRVDTGSYKGWLYWRDNADKAHYIY